jgi:hypothetical protein
MRNLIIVVALLAAAKVAYQEYLFRVATREVIVATYQERAAQSCQRNAKSQNLKGDLTVWVKPTSVSLVIGKSNLDVYFWQVSSSLWNARFRNPYLYLVAEEKPALVYCEYDILNNSATVHRL